MQEHLPGPEYSLDVLARADGHVAAVVPRERMKVDSGIAVTGRTLHDEALEEFGREVAAAIGLTRVANVQVKGAAGGEPALLEVNARFPGTMPLTVASGVDMPGLAIGEALGSRSPTARSRSRTSRWCASSRSGSSRSRTSQDLQRHAAGTAS